MALVRYTPHRTFAPWPEFETLTNRLSRIFAEPWDTPEPTGTGTWFPSVNVQEAPDELILTAELPGLLEEDVHVEIENNILTIRGEKREEREEGDEDRRFHVWERRFGSFQRAFTLPRSVQGDSIRAHFENGVLTLHMPKADEAKSRRIEIKAKK